MKFEIGDRVEIIANWHKSYAAGSCGTVLALKCISDGQIVGVEHDSEFYGGHNLGGLCRDGCGYWYHNSENQLMLISDDKSQITADGLEDLL